MDCCIISFMVAFGVVGVIFDLIGFYDSDIMSDCHWFVRLIVFVGLSIICIAVMKFISWLFSFQWWIYIIIIISIILIIILIYLIKYRYAKNKASKIKPTNNNEAIEKTEGVPENVNNRENCPRCGGLLIKRYGPYGDFYGCENFSAFNCRYTRIR